MVEEIPEVESSVRMLSRWTLGRQTVRFGDNWFYEGNYLTVDDTFFDVFDFEFVSGSRSTALDGPGKVVLTESAVELYFGDVEPMGKTINLERQGDFVVSAVIRDPTPDTHVHFSMLTSMSTMTAVPGFAEFIDGWDSQNFITYLLLREGASIESVQSKMDQLIASNTNEELRGTRKPFLQAMADVHFGSAQIDYDENAGQISRSTVNMLSLVGLFILVIACINYTNMATAASTQRAKEVGMRKAVGADKGQLVKQFMSESLATTMMAFVVALVLAWLALEPFNLLTGKDLTMNPAQNPAGAFTLGVLVLLVGSISGGYPAFYLSRFNPVAVLKGGASTSRSSNMIRQSLVVAQFALSIGLIIASLVVYRQLQYIQNTNLGFNQDQVLVVDINSGGPRSGFRAMKEEIASDVTVLDVSVSSNIPGDWKNITQVDVGNADVDAEERITSYFLGVDADFLSTYQISLLDGRNFSPDAIADSMSVLVTESTAKRLGLAVGSRISVPGSSLAGRFSSTMFEPTVVGIVNDFNFKSLHEDIDPMILGYHTNPVDVIDYFSIRIDGQDVVSTLAHVQAVNERFDPTHPFEFNFLDERIQDFYVAESRLSRIFNLATGLAILIACLGLFSLAAFMTTRRTKEIGIRKVLGASVPGIVRLLSWEIVRLVAISFVVAAPLSWFVMNRWLDTFAFRMDLGVGTMVLAGVISILLAIATVGYQSIRAATADPVNSLRYE